MASAKVRKKRPRSPAVVRTNGHGQKATEPWVQLATRIPKTLHRELKLHCVTAETGVMDFVVAAIGAKLGGPKRGVAAG